MSINEYDSEAPSISIRVGRSKVGTTRIGVFVKARQGDLRPHKVFEIGPGPLGIHEWDDMGAQIADFIAEWLITVVGVQLRLLAP